MSSVTQESTSEVADNFGPRLQCSSPSDLNNSSVDQTLDIDAPDSVRSNVTQPEDVRTPRSQFKPSNQYQCSKCGKKFNTSTRYSNHRKNCMLSDTVGGVQKPVLKHKYIKKKPNPRFEELKSNWSESLLNKERCGKCGRTNYIQDDLAKHQATCRGTLMNVKAKYVCPYCTDYKHKAVFNNEHSMRRHVSTSHPKEAVEDEWDYKAKKSRSKGLAENHLFR